ncbi:phosphatidylinositol-4-phosphate 5-kinase-domain-containing protein [Syncephalis pseudoplumigaleata]|uniref:Phosphatidylinositol-4-phosphate 5-kinase-domain-containing protein n=1 Tax=Syncephalis pseudoplumigaleata TaxID=1712513 RepID=A0A4P9Z1W7_9FUNG|nr:phosphatidylinositol-4-phosphate 5-kinase-domain-containing protein [Syncephalis pseudoplumigaleata]|eukprot:RKP25962.1 phosphatidylinositol-4-phosphate 5-kinase-domain-containing protein [Syncephalis pseudoplumigaleata]
MDAFVSFVLGVLTALLCCVAYVHWQSHYSHHTEQQPLLGSTAGRPRSNTVHSSSGATLSEPSTEHHHHYHHYHRTLGAGLTWLASRLFSLSSPAPPRRPRLDTATISSPLHAPVVGSYLPILRSMMRPPPLPVLGDASVRWADYGRKRELAQSVLQHLTREPPLGRHLRMAVRAVLHLSHISPEAMAIDALDELDAAPPPPIDQNKPYDEASTRASLRRKRPPMRRKTIAPLLQETMQEENDDEEEKAAVARSVKAKHRSMSTSMEADRPLSDPTLLEAIARFHAHEMCVDARKDALHNGDGTPHATPVTSHIGTMAGIDDTIHSRWDTAVLVAAPSSPTRQRARHAHPPIHATPPLDENEDPDATPRVSRMVQARHSIRSTKHRSVRREDEEEEEGDDEDEDEAEKTFVYTSEMHPMDERCLSTSPEADAVMANGDERASEEVSEHQPPDERQLRASLEELQQRKRSRKRGDLLSTLMDMSAMSLGNEEEMARRCHDRSADEPASARTTIVAGKQPGTGATAHTAQRQQSVYSERSSRVTSTAFDTDASFYTPPETPNTTMRKKTQAASIHVRQNSNNNAAESPSSSPLPRIQLSPPLLDKHDSDGGNNARSTPTQPRRAHSTRRRNAPSSSTTTAGISLDTPFFTAEQHHEWHVPGYGRVRFTDHCPQVFAELRRRFGVQLAEIDEALCSPFEQVTRTAGKSEAIFFATHSGEKDNACRRKFLFKTLRGSEPENLKGFLPRYLAHVRQYPDTLLPRYLGMFTFERPATPAVHHSYYTTHTANGAGHPSTSPPPLSSSPTAFTSRLNDVVSTMASPISPAFARDAASVMAESNRSSAPIPMPTTDEAFPARMTLVLMLDVFDTPLAIHERYDFKGSTVGRHALPLGTAEEADDVSRVTMKELDFRHRLHSGKAHYFTISKRIREQMLHQLELDTALLKEFDFMDYSLLIGVHKCPRDSASKSYRTIDTSDVHSRASTSHSTPASLAATGTGQGSMWSTPSIYSLASHANAGSLGQGRSRLVSFISKLIWTRRRQQQQQQQQQQLEEGTISSGRTAPMPAPTYGSSSADIDRSNADADEVASLWMEGIASSGLPTREIYFIGIIDILQRYTLFKKIERGIKGANVHLRGAVDATVVAAARDGNKVVARNGSPPARGSRHDEVEGGDGRRLLSLSSTWSNGAMAVREMLTLEREEFSVEEPGRYAERLLAFVRSVIKEH